MPSRIREVVGQNLRRLRKLVGLSQEALGRRAGVHENTIRNIERGKVENTGIHSLETIAAVMGFELEDLVLGEVPTTEELEASWRAFVKLGMLSPPPTDEERAAVVRRGIFRFGPPTPAVWYHAISMLRSSTDAPK